MNRTEQSLKIWRVVVVLIYDAEVFLNGLAVFITSLRNP